MENAIFIIIFIISAVVIVFWSFNNASKNKKAANGIINYDSFMRRFCYKVQMKREEVLKALSIPSVYDELEHKFDLDQLIITFLKHDARVRYKLSISEADGFCLLRVEQIGWITDRTTIPYFINSFWIKKLNAILIPYTD